MSSGFSDPLVGGGGDLVYPQISSPNFSLAEQTGWAILKNGNAYFFNITAEGTITGSTFDGNDFIINQAGAFFYSGTPANGNLIASIASANGTDGFGNAYIEGIVSYATASTYVQMLGGFVKFEQAGNPAAAVIGSNTSASLNLSSGQTASDPTECILDLVPGSSSTPAQAELANSVLWMSVLNTGQLPVIASAFAVQLVPNPDGHLQYVSTTAGAGGDGNTYDTGRATLLTTPQTISSTTPAQLTGLGWAVAAGTYRIHGMIPVEQGTTSVTQLMGFSGPATSLVSISSNWVLSQGFATTVNMRRFTALTTGSTPAFTISTIYEWHIDGIITFSAPGTLEAVGAEGTAGDNWQVLAGGFIELMPVG